MAGDQSVALQVAQRLGEHALGDVADGSAKLAKALRSRREARGYAGRCAIPGWLARVA